MGCRSCEGGGEDTLSSLLVGYSSWGGVVSVMEDRRLGRGGLLLESEMGDVVGRGAGVSPNKEVRLEVILRTWGLDSSMSGPGGPASYTHSS